jgi:hypothetical protein
MRKNCIKNAPAPIDHFPATGGSRLNFAIMRIIMTAKASSLEGARATVSREEVLRYFGDVIGALKICRTPRQILNMDESGLSARPSKGKQKRVVFSTGCNVQPYWLDARDVTHVSLVATISLLCEALPPLFLTVSRVPLADPMLRSLSAKFTTYQTAKGYMTTPAILFYIEQCLAPYCADLRRQ